MVILYFFGKLTNVLQRGMKQFSSVGQTDLKMLTLDLCGFRLSRFCNDE